MSRWTRNSQPEPRVTNPDVLERYRVAKPAPPRPLAPPVDRVRWCRICCKNTRVLDDWTCQRCGAGLEISWQLRRCHCGRTRKVMFRRNREMPLRCQCEQTELERRREKQRNREREKRERVRRIDAEHAATARACWRELNQSCDLKTNELFRHCYSCLRPAIAKGKVRAPLPDYDAPLPKTTRRNDEK